MKIFFVLRHTEGEETKTVMRQFGGILQKRFSFNFVEKDKNQ